MKKNEKSPWCWKEIGIAGDGSCPRLKDFIHCRNCPVYAESGRGLLDRDLPPNYLDEWTEWLALPTACFNRIAPERPVHTIPHRSGKLLRGLVNIDGELLLCVALDALLGIEPEEGKADPGGPSTARLVVMRLKENRWVFRADAIDAIHPVNPAKAIKPPVTAAKAAVSFTSGLVDLPNKTAALLREDAIATALNKVFES